jgi:hypothetical protein
MAAGLNINRECSLVCIREDSQYNSRRPNVARDVFIKLKDLYRKFIFVSASSEPPSLLLLSQGP